MATLTNAERRFEESVTRSVNAARTLVSNLGELNIVKRDTQRYSQLRIKVEDAYKQAESLQKQLLDIQSRLQNYH